MIDEGPSEDDLRRFGDDAAGDTGDDTVRCPSCGAEIWHDAERCPKCGDYVTPGRAGRGTSSGARWLVVIAIIVLIAFVLTYVF